MSTKPDDRAPDAQNNWGVGIPLLISFNLLAGLGTGLPLLHLLSSHHREDRILALSGAVSGGGMELSAICLAIGLMVRRPWNWRVAVGAQAVAVACQLFPAMLGLYLAGTVSGDWKWLGVIGGLLVFAVAMIPVLVSCVGLFYLMRPRVRARFHPESSDR